jgi:hypothetical protein
MCQFFDENEGRCRIFTEKKTAPGVDRDTGNAVRFAVENALIFFYRTAQLPKSTKKQLAQA